MLLMNNHLDQTYSYIVTKLAFHTEIKNTSMHFAHCARIEDS
jgi:hypothetical protein